MYCTIFRAAGCTVSWALVLQSQAPFSLLRRRNNEIVSIRSINILTQNCLNIRRYIYCYLCYIVLFTGVRKKSRISTRLSPDKTLSSLMPYRRCFANKDYLQNYHTTVYARSQELFVFKYKFINCLFIFSIASGENEIP